MPESKDVMVLLLLCFAGLEVGIVIKVRKVDLIWTDIRLVSQNKLVSLRKYCLAWSSDQLISGRKKGARSDQTITSTLLYSIHGLTRRCHIITIHANTERERV